MTKQQKRRIARRRRACRTIVARGPRNHVEQHRAQMYRNNIESLMASMAETMQGGQAA